MTGERSDYLPELPIHSSRTDELRAAPPADVTTGEPSAHRERREWQPQVRIHGYLDGEVHVAPTEHGGTIARFAVAVPAVDGATTSHQVVAFNSLAERAKASLQPGQPVEVMGYEHVSETTDPDGTSGQVTQIHAASVMPRNMLRLL